MKSADSLYYDLELRLRDINSIIAKGNDTVKRLISSGSDKIFYKGEMHTGSELYNMLVSYGAEKRHIESLLKFYNGIII